MGRVIISLDFLFNYFVLVVMDVILATVEGVDAIQVDWCCTDGVESRIPFIIDTLCTFTFPLLEIVVSSTANSHGRLSSIVHLRISCKHLDYVIHKRQ